MENVFSINFFYKKKNVFNTGELYMLLIEQSNNKLYEIKFN